MGDCHRHVSLGRGLAMCMPRSSLGPFARRLGRVHCRCILWALTS